MGFESSLEEYHNVPDFLLKIGSHFRMEGGLLFPDDLELIKVILSVEDFIFRAEVRVFLNIRIKELPYSLFVEV